MQDLKKCSLASKLRSFFVFVLLCVSPVIGFSQDSILCDIYENICDSSSSGGKSGSITPSGSQRIRMNPAAVPTGNVFGLGAIFFKSEADLMLVKGMGRIGAAISPANSEETFFGPPAFELPDEYLERKKQKNKFKNSKINLATGFDLYRNRKSGLSRFDLSLGVMGKYHKETSEALPGAGVYAVLGPFSLGYSVYQDQMYLDYSDFDVDRKATTKYLVETYSGTLFLESFIFDYSVLQTKTADISTVRTTTASVLWKRAILSAAIRIENSARQKYSYSKESLLSEREKSDLFLAFQYKLNKHLMVGLLSNYYLVNEWSGSVTLFF